MLLRELTLHNFGGYRGRHTVNLAPPDDEQPVVLFGGLNGAGKTTLLDALQLVLYGKRGRCAGRANLAYDEYLRRSINRGVAAREGAAVELTFEATFDGAVSVFRVHRSWAPSDVGTNIREHLLVTRDDIDSILLTERWDELVEELLPLDISSLFFFDGEKIEALADPERAGRVVATAVEALLGLNLLDRLNVDLVALERRKRAVVADEGVKQQLAALEERVARARAERARLLQEQAARQNEVDRAEAELRNAERVFRREGGELFERRADLERRRQEAHERLKTIEAQLVEIASGSLPLRLVTNLLEQVRQQRQVEVDAHRAELLRDVLAERDDAVVNHVAAAAPDDVVASLRAFLSEDRRVRAAPADAARYLHASEDFDARLAFVYPNELDRAARESTDLLTERTAAEADVDELDRQLAAVPSEDAIAAATRLREECTQGLAEARARLTVAAEAVQDASKVVDTAEAELQRTYRDATAAIATEEDAHRVVEHAGRVRSTIGTFKTALLERHLNRIEAAVLDSLRRLLRKQHLVSDLRIDPETFELSLYDASGQTVPTERLSAGERQLLAVAMLWGLARVSGRRLPMVIDTPLGRLDSTHRQLIVERYFPAASHQVVLLSTDEEIDEGLLQTLGPAIGRSYELRHDDVAGGTSIVDGYFWGDVTDVA
jgi:DNA sulfur modification protein DndD